MSNKTRKRFLPVALVMAVAAISVVALAIALTSAPRELQAHGGSGGDCSTELGRAIHDALSPNDPCPAPTMAPTMDPAMTPARYGYGHLPMARRASPDLQRFGRAPVWTIQLTIPEQEYARRGGQFHRAVPGGRLRSSPIPSPARRSVLPGSRGRLCHAAAHHRPRRSGVRHHGRPE